MSVHARRFLVAAIPTWIAASVTPCAVRADDDPMGACIAWSDKGLDLRKQGKLFEARRVLVSCAAATCGPEISGVCQKRLADVNAAMPSIIFLPRDRDGKDVVGVTVSIDGATTRAPLDGLPIPIDPGPHTFHFEAAGHPTVDRSFVIAESAKNRQEPVDMSLPRPASTAPSDAGRAGAGGGSKTAAWAVGAVGLVGVAAGSVFGLLAMSESSASKNDCPTTPTCTNYWNARSEHDTAAAEATASTIAFAVGGVALGAAAYLFLATPPAHQATSASTFPRLEPTFGPGGAAMTLRGSFE